MQTLILPGIDNAGPDHWQSHWHALYPGYLRIDQDDWAHPQCAAWLERLEQCVRQCGPDTVLVAHSLGCLLVAQWAAVTGLSIKAALLVAVPDPTSPSFSAQATGFSALAERPLPFPSLVVASSSDPFGSLEYAERCAGRWGSALVNIGDAGHINAASGLGAWPEGHALFQRWLALVV
ncbi:RBBP9/YdeN family alpha/beta hydrolase [Pseudomonas borbori]